MKNYSYSTKYKTMLGDLHTPVTTYLKLRDLFPQSALMESSDYHGSEDNRSFIGLKPIASISVNHDIVTCKYPDGDISEKAIDESYSVENAINEFLSAFKDRKSTRLNSSHQIISYA